MTTEHDTKPITPDEVIARRTDNYPPGAMKVINDLVAENWDGTEARVSIQEVIDTLARNGFGTQDEQRRKHLWDFEPTFEAAGWRCVFEKPGFNETGFRGFIFTPRSKQ